jgi:Sulfotransferase domain
VRPQTRDRVVVYTMHRSGSMLLHRVLRQLVKHSGHRYVSPNRGADERVSVHDVASDPDRWLSQPGCFGPFRVYIPVPRSDDCRMLLHLRDPRDVLVSMFYAYCYSHSGPLPGDTGYRGEIARAGIDAFVIQMATAEQSPVQGTYGTGADLWDFAGNLRDRYAAYLKFVHGRDNTIFLRYEDMIDAPAAWLRSVANVMGVDDPDLLDDLTSRAESSFTVKRGEDAWSHRRQVTPGDHRDKLKPETISCLNGVFGEALEALRYPS